MHRRHQDRSRSCANAAIALAALSVVMLSGCYKELPPQERVQAPPAQAAPQTPAEKPVQSNPGVAPPASSALGAAKRSAQNTVQQAEQASQKTADSVDKDE